MDIALLAVQQHACFIIRELTSGNMVQMNKQMEQMKGGQNIRNPSTQRRSPKETRKETRMMTPKEIAIENLMTEIKKLSAFGYEEDVAQKRQNLNALLSR